MQRSFSAYLFSLQYFFNRYPVFVLQTLDKFSVVDFKSFVFVPDKTPFKAVLFGIGLESIKLVGNLVVNVFALTAGFFTAFGFDYPHLAVFLFNNVVGVE